MYYQLDSTFPNFTHDKHTNVHTLATLHVCQKYDTERFRREKNISAVSYFGGTNCGFLIFI